MNVLLEFWQKIMVIPIMNPLSWFMINFLEFLNSADPCNSKSHSLVQVQCYV